MSGSSPILVPPLSEWDALPETDQVEVANAVRRRLHSNWAFLGLEAHEMEGQRHRIAFFRWRRTRFALIPGDTATLGYDRRHPFVPTAAQQADWEATRREYGDELEQVLDANGTPLREVTLLPFLLQVRASPLDPQGDAFIWGEKPWPKRGYSPKFFFADDVAAELSSHGFRLPTSDEWEYACAAGARTLFRWGDGCPVDRSPIDETGWESHRRPNAFGLLMPSNPYQWEFVAEPTILRGGDGGARICSGASVLEGWLPLASAWHNRIPRRTKRDVGWPGVYLRRAMSLPAA
jgi:sulfatase-modifying factor enzyme 1